FKSVVLNVYCVLVFFFFQAEDGIRDGHVTGVQTCALPISNSTEGGESGRKAGSPEGRDMVYLEVQESSGELVRILVSDPGGVGIEFRFANWQLNPQLDDSFFRFQVPPGVAIVNGDLGAAQKMASPTPP